MANHNAVVAGAAAAGLAVGLIGGAALNSNPVADRVIRTLRDEGTPTIAFLGRDNKPVIVNDKGERLAPCTEASCNVVIRLSHSGEPKLINRATGAEITPIAQYKTYQYKYHGSNCTVWYYGGTILGDAWYYNHCGNIQW